MNIFRQVFYEQPGGGGGGGGSSGDPGGGGGQQQQQQAQPYRPQGLPDNYFGGSDKETIDKMWPALSGFMRANSERGSVPEKPDLYKFDLSEKAKPIVQIGAEDKLMPKIAQLAQKHKFTDKQYAGFMGEFFDTVVDMGLIPPPIDPNAMYMDLGKGKGTTEAEIKQAGTQRLNQAQAWINGLGEQQGFDKEMRDELALFTTSATGVKVLEALMKGDVKRSVSAGGGPGGNEGITAEQVRARQADPRNIRGSDKYDQAFAEETIKLYKQVYGSNP